MELSGIGIDEMVLTPCLLDSHCAIVLIEL